MQRAINQRPLYADYISGYGDQLTLFPWALFYTRTITWLPVCKSKIESTSPKTFFLEFGMHELFTRSKKNSGQTFHYFMSHPKRKITASLDRVRCLVLVYQLQTAITAHVEGRFLQNRSLMTTSHMRSIIRPTQYNNTCNCYINFFIENGRYSNSFHSSQNAEKITKNISDALHRKESVKSSSRQNRQVVCHINVKKWQLTALSMQKFTE